MSARCPQGHRWEFATSPHCPICGAAPQHSDDLNRETLEATTAAGEPMASTSSPAAPVPVVEPTLPTFPGYEILGVLGRGGMGMVYIARQVQLKRLVALKMILSGAQAADHELARFRTEAEAVARLQHPNIVQIYEIGAHGGRQFFSFEFVDGGSLDKRISDVGLTARASAELVETLARAMHTAHQRGIVHRDLKPANVLLTADGVPKITDFGLAKQLDDDSSQTHSGAILGTPSYMAPEQALGSAKQIGPATDIYALGAILYELLTGRPPFRGPTLLDTLELVRSQDVVPPRRLHPAIPRDLETICLQAMHKDPAHRYASAQALADDLHRFLEGESIEARRMGLATRALRWLQKPERVRDAGVVMIVHAVIRAVIAIIYIAGILQHLHSATLDRETKIVAVFVAVFPVVLFWAGWRTLDKNILALWTGFLMAVLYLSTRFPAIWDTIRPAFDGSPFELHDMLNLAFLYHVLAALQLVTSLFALRAYYAHRHDVARNADSRVGLREMIP